MPSRMEEPRAEFLSVALKERQQVIITAAAHVWRIQIGQKITWIHQIWKQLSMRKT